MSEVPFTRGRSHARHTCNLGILFIAGFGPIVRDTAKRRKLYAEIMGSWEYALQRKPESICILRRLAALKPLCSGRYRTQSCFGKDSWPDNVPVPQAWLEFDVINVEKATSELDAEGYKMLVKNRKESWGHVVSRFLSPEGLLVGVAFTPALSDNKREAS